MFIFKMKSLCDICGNKCFKTEYGSSIFFCKTETLCCLNCHKSFRDYINFKKNNNILPYILNRQILSNKNKKPAIFRF